MRLVALLDTYRTALAELRALDDPGVAGLVARLETLEARAALDLFGSFEISDVIGVRRTT